MYRTLGADSQRSACIRDKLDPMIKFFRKIRQKLLAENNFSKYLMYAVGEIILVVIGILIALQINTWNEYKKDRVEEKDILTISFPPLSLRPLDTLKNMLSLSLKNQIILNR